MKPASFIMLTNFLWTLCRTLEVSHTSASSSQNLPAAASSVGCQESMGIDQRLTKRECSAFLRLSTWKGWNAML